MYSRSSCSRCRQLVWVAREEIDKEQVQCRRCKLHLASPVVATCGICLEALSDPVRYTRVSNESWTNEKCDHLFCRSCLKGHLRARLEDGMWNIRCPAVSCSYLWIEADIQKVAAPGALVDEADRAAAQAEGDELLKRFRDLRDAEYGTHLRAILLERDEAEEEERRRQQAALNDSDVEDNGEDNADGEELGKATTVEEEPLQADDLADSLDFGSWARRACQACPTCLVVIRKETGCDHMQCRCGTSFCYGCGAPIGDHHQCICVDTTGMGPKLAMWLRARGKLP